VTLVSKIVHRSYIIFLSPAFIHVTGARSFSS